MKFYYSLSNRKITKKLRTVSFLSIISFSVYSKLAEELLKCHLNNFTWDYSSPHFLSRTRVEALLPACLCTGNPDTRCILLTSLLSSHPTQSSQVWSFTLASAQCPVRIASKVLRQEKGRRNREFNAK